jgi:hypothetical protein
VRVAFLASLPISVPIDFCYGPVGGTQVGPVLGGLGSSGLNSGQVSRYFEFDDLTGGTVGTDYTVTAFPLLGSGSGCTGRTLAQSFTVPVVGGHRVTLVVSGTISISGGAPDTTAFEDDTTAPAGEASIRFVHADASHGGVDFGQTGSGNSFTALFTNVPYKGSSVGQTGANANGYLAHAPITGTLAVRATGVSGSNTNLATNTHGAPADTAKTFFFDNLTNKLLGCVDDGEVAAVGDTLSTCQ